MQQIQQRQSRRNRGLQPELQPGGAGAGAANNGAGAGADAAAIAAAGEDTEEDGNGEMALQPPPPLLDMAADPGLLRIRPRRRGSSSGGSGSIGGNAG